MKLKIYCYNQMLETIKVFFILKKLKYEFITMLFNDNL